MKNDLGARIGYILMPVVLIFTIIGIIFGHENGPASGALFLLTLVAGFTAFIIIISVTVFISQSIRGKASKRKAAQYRSKYISLSEYETAPFGTLVFIIDSNTNSACAQFFDSGRETDYVIEVENSQPLILKALGSLEMVNENFDEYSETAKHLIAENTDCDISDLSAPDEIRIYSDSSEIYAELMIDTFAVAFLCTFGDEIPSADLDHHPQAVSQPVKDRFGTDGQ